METSDIAVATLSWARDSSEERLLRESLTVLAALDVPVYVADGGSGEQFVEFLRGLPRFELSGASAPGVWPQVRSSLRAAHESGARFILYTEPDKGDFFRTVLPGFLSEAPAGGEVGVVLASRSAASFATFPEFQRHTETMINRCCAELLGSRADFTYGPFLLNSEIVPHLLSLPDDIGWGWRPYAFGTARRLGYRLCPLEKDLPCPPAQREDDGAERLYRMKQLVQNVQGLLAAGTADPPRP